MSTSSEFEKEPGISVIAGIDFVMTAMHSPADM
jgi:hypothetical protein